MVACGDDERDEEENLRVFGPAERALVGEADDALNATRREKERLERRRVGEALPEGEKRVLDEEVARVCGPFGVFPNFSHFANFVQLRVLRCPSEQLVDGEAYQIFSDRFQNRF